MTESRSESSSTAASSKGSGRPPVVSKRQRGGRSGAPTRLPTPTMISDFRAEPPKVYPHTCSLCHKRCEQAKVSDQTQLCQCAANTKLWELWHRPRAGLCSTTLTKMAHGNTKLYFAIQYITVCTVRLKLSSQVQF